MQVFSLGKPGQERESPSTLEINITMLQSLPEVAEVFPWSVKQPLHSLCRLEEKTYRLGSTLVPTTGWELPLSTPAGYFPRIHQTHAASSFPPGLLSETSAIKKSKQNNFSKTRGQASGDRARNH